MTAAVVPENVSQVLLAAIIAAGIGLALVLIVAWLIELLTLRKKKS